MHRRTFLESTCALTAGLAAAPTSIAANSADDGGPPGVAWRRTYDDFPTQTVVPAHDGGYVLVNRGQLWSDSGLPVRVAVVDETGTVKRRREIDPDVPDDARRARADVTRTASGYAIAMGTWFAKLDAELSIRTTGFASGYVSNLGTRVTEVSDGFVVARDVNYPERLYTRVLKFGSDGDLRWTRRYGDDEGWGLAPLTFLEKDPDGGVVVGGPSGQPWLASLGSDGKRRWKTTVTDASGFGYDATVDGEGITLLGKTGLLRLASDRSVAWQRSFDELGGGAAGGLTRTADGGYVLVKMIDGIRFVTARTDANGRLQWRHTYAAGSDTDATYGVWDAVECAPGEYIVVGTAEGAAESHWGWALHLSETHTPPPIPTTVPTTTRTQVPLETNPPIRTPSATPTTTPGFGVGAALAGLAAGWLVRRR